MTQRDVALAYNAIAADYDPQVAGDEWMRRVIWSLFECLFQPGHRVLDVACGTGVDAAFLAQRGVIVTGIDISPAMIAQMRLRIERLQMADRIDSHVMDLAQLASWPPASFDGIVSAFAGLNSEPDLAGFAANAARLLRPRGHLVLHMLNRFSLWEWLGLLRDRQWTAARELGRRSQRDFTIGGLAVRHYLFSPYEVQSRFFARHFKIRRVCGLGILRPPHTVRRIPPRAVAALAWMERRLGSRRPCVNWGRFFLLVLEKRDKEE